MLLSRQSDQLNRWTQSSGSALKENILLEQFLQSLPTDLAVKLRERKPATAKEASGWADDYDQAHREEQTAGQMKQPTPPAPRDEASLQHKSFPKRGTTKKGAAGSAVSSFRSKTNSKGEWQCFECRNWGHIAAFCPEKQASGAKADVKPAMLSKRCPEITNSPHGTRSLMAGTLDGQPVQVLVDTGSRMSVARAVLVDQSKWKEKEVELQCVHGDTASYPLADVMCELDGWKKEVTVAVVPGLPIDFLIGCDDHLSFAGMISANSSLPVMTRSPKRKQMRESGCRQEERCGAAEKMEGNGPASARGPVSRYLPQHPEPNPACGSTQERKQLSTRGIEQQQDNPREVNIPDAHSHRFYRGALSNSLATKGVAAS